MHERQEAYRLVQPDSRRARRGLASDQEQLLTSIDTALKPSQDIRLDGSQLEQHHAIKKLRTSTRYHRALATRHAIQTFAEKLRKE